MGQARARGTYEQRKVAAIEKNKKLAEELAEVRRYAPVQKLSPRDLRALAALNMLVVTSRDWARMPRLG